MERTKYLIVALVSIVFGAAGFALWSSAQHVAPTEHEPEFEVIHAPSVMMAVTRVGRLEGAVFYMERVQEVSESQRVLFGTLSQRDSLLMTVSARVRAGVDLGKLNADDINVTGTRVRLKLPAPEVLSVEIDERRTRVYRRDTDPLAKQNPALESKARASASSSLRRAAIDVGLLEEAKAGIEQTLTGMIFALGFTDVRIEFTPLSQEQSPIQLESH